MIAAGFGFRASADAASLADALARASGGRTADRIAAPEDKARAACLCALAASLGLVVFPVPPEAMRRAETATRSPRLLATRGTGSVAEAAALAAAGPGARLLAPRAVSGDGRATCALAEGSTS